MSEQTSKHYVVTNKARGGRMILTPTGGATVFAGQSSIFELTPNELKAAKPYFDNGDLVYREATEAEVGSMPGSGFVSASQNATPSSDGASTQAQSDAGGDEALEQAAKAGQTDPVIGLSGSDVILGAASDGADENGPSVTNVKHMGFGRWYGMNGDEKVTEAMTRPEAEAYSQEHKVPIGDAPDPADEGEGEGGGAPDETAAES